MWPRVLRFLLGLILGALLWAWLTPAYNRFLARCTAPLVRLDSRFADAELVSGDNQIEIRSPRGGFPTASIPADQLTYNVILLLALFLSNPKPYRDRNVVGFFLSLFALVISHPFGALISIESTYALRLGKWSETHYSDFAANFWLIAEMFYRLIGMFAFVFVCWWLALMRRGGRRDNCERTLMIL